jgi:hypothetical protein
LKENLAGPLSACQQNDASEFRRPAHSEASKVVPACLTPLGGDKPESEVSYMDADETNPERTMSQPELAYLFKFRDAAKEQVSIEQALQNLAKLCDSLKDWKDTAAKLASQYPPEAWQAEPPSLTALRNSLVYYARLHAEAESLWNRIPAESRIGLAAPGSAK